MMDWPAIFEVVVCLRMFNHVFNSGQDLISTHFRSFKYLCGLVLGARGLPVGDACYDDS